MDAASAVDQLLRARHASDLEAALGQGCVMGALPAPLAQVARIVPRRVSLVREADGGESSVYEGMLIVEECRYRFRVHLFTDLGGAWFL